MYQDYYIWIEIQANKKTIIDINKFYETMKKCSSAGINAIILSVKDTSGFVIYNSKIAPHYYEYDEIFSKIDYLERCIEMVHSLGMKIYAGVDVMAEGNRVRPHEKMLGIKYPEWQVKVYGLNSEGEGCIQEVSSSNSLEIMGSIDDFGEVFVNPGNEEVCQYELSLLEEICDHYNIDGIVLDRVRYVGLSTDFSNDTKEKLQQEIADLVWPEDIYTLIKKDNKIEIEYGRYFGVFLEYRARTIKSFIERVSNLLKQKSIHFLDYTGSWYPLYYQVGANWGSQEYEPKEYPGVEAKSYQKTGYVEMIDGLLSGFYYPQITEEEAYKTNQPAYWYSVEGAARIAYQVTQHKVPIIGSLFLDQYKEQPLEITRAIKMCFEKSNGCMLFDLSYVVDNDWFSYITYSQQTLSIEPLHKEDQELIKELWDSCFETCYQVSQEKIKNNIFLDRQYYALASKCIKDTTTGKLIGMIVCKISDAEDLLYKQCAWVSIFMIHPKYQGRGIGKKLYNEAEAVLKAKGIRKVYIGQDINNFFSGIPNPTFSKIKFFKELDFIVNQDEHYDLLGNVKDNKKIDSFNTEIFEEIFMISNLSRVDKESFLRFLKEEFPGRWYMEAEIYLEQNQNLEDIIVLIEKSTQKIKGYCCISIGEGKNGGLGPIGIAKSIRGKSNGEYILQQSLLNLRQIGAEYVCIDWTILKDYYGKFNFVPIRIYRGAYKEIR